VEGDFRLVQRPSRWAGEALVRTLMWLRQVYRDPLLAGADLLYSRIPAMLALGGARLLPFAVDHYRPWPDDLPAIRPLVRRTAREPSLPRPHPPFRLRRRGLSPRRGRAREDPRRP
jgi:hypothetical protein